MHIVDRAKDMIIRGGENIYSVEVESALYEHPAVADCAVIGVPDPVLGEEVGAVIVFRPGREVAADELGPSRRRAAGRLQRADPVLVPLRPAATQPGGQGAQARTPRRAPRGNLDRLRRSGNLCPVLPDGSQAPRIPHADLPADEKAVLAGSFGAVATHYQRYRPGPAAAAVDWYLPDPVERAVDLGAGPGHSPAS